MEQSQPLLCLNLWEEGALKQKCNVNPKENPFIKKKNNRGKKHQ
jgi:hypothetical protein